MTQEIIFRETQPEETPDLINDPYVIVISIRADDAIHAIDSNSYLRGLMGNKTSSQMIAQFSETLSRLRYDDMDGVNDAIDEAYAAIGRAVAWQMEQDIRDEMIEAFVASALQDKAPLDQPEPEEDNVKKQEENNGKDG